MRMNALTAARIFVKMLCCGALPWALAAAVEASWASAIQFVRWAYVDVASASQKFVVQAIQYRRKCAGEGDMLLPVDGVIPISILGSTGLTSRSTSLQHKATHE
eukprot:SAG11_NODE_20385_length_446_cov_1.276657_1_plen_103_part_10